MGLSRLRWTHCVGSTKLACASLAILTMALVPRLAMAQAVGSVAILDHGKLLLIMTRASLCDGHPVAMIVDRQGHKFDQTCEVTYSPGGMSTKFSSETHATYWPKERFESVRLH